ncbi:MAG: ATP-binding protein [Parvibaculales bacterium]
MTEILRITVDAEISALRVIRRALSKALKAALKSPQAAEKIQDILLATDEAAQNIIQHAFKQSSAKEVKKDKDEQLTLIVQKQKAQLHIVLEDNAPLVDISQIVPRKLDEVREGGLGTHFIKSLSDEARWSHHDNGNRLDMIWHLPQ